MPGLSHEEYAPILESMRKTCVLLGKPFPGYVWIDNQGDASLWQRVFPETIGQPVDPAPLHLLTKLEPFTVDMTKVLVISSFPDALQVLPFLQTTINEHGWASLDLEWDVNIGGSARGAPQRGPVLQSPVAVISIATPDGNCYLFHVANWPRIPEPFIKFLEEPWLKVGRGIKGDAKKLAKDFSISIPDQHCVDLAILAKQKGIIDNAGGKESGLAALAEKILERHLPKPLGIRVSQLWSQKPMPDSRKQYAAGDVLASGAIYTKLSDMVDENIRLSERPGDIKIGTLVDVEDRFGKDRRVVARGLVVEIGNKKGRKIAGISLSSCRCLVAIETFIPSATLHFPPFKNGHDSRAGVKESFKDLALGDKVVFDIRYMKFASRTSNRTCRGNRDR